MTATGYNLTIFKANKALGLINMKIMYILHADFYQNIVNIKSILHIPELLKYICRTGKGK